jgi:hypothetical protein
MKFNKDQLTNLAKISIRFVNVNEIAPFVEHMMAAQDAGRRLGWETSVWHEYSIYSGKPCVCNKCK